MSASAPRADAAPALAGVGHGHSISIDFADPDGTPDEITTYETAALLGRPVAG